MAKFTAIYQIDRWSMTRTIGAQTESVAIWLACDELHEILGAGFHASALTVEPVAPVQPTPPAREGTDQDAE